MSKLWEAIKDLERERDLAAKSAATRESSRQALATYVEEIRQRPRQRGEDEPH